VLFVVSIIYQHLGIVTANITFLIKKARLAKARQAINSGC